MAPIAAISAERDGQVVVAAFLGQVGGREIDGDALGGQRQARGDQRGAHPLARLSATALSAQADDIEHAVAAGAICTCTSTGARLDALETPRWRPA